MQCRDVIAYLRDRLQITCFDYYSLQRNTVHGTKVIREHDITEEVYLDKLLHLICTITVFNGVLQKHALQVNNFPKECHPETKQGAKCLFDTYRNNFKSLM